MKKGLHKTACTFCRWIPIQKAPLPRKWKCQDCKAVTTER